MGRPPILRVARRPGSISVPPSDTIFWPLLLPSSGTGSASGPPGSPRGTAGTLGRAASAARSTSLPASASYSSSPAAWPVMPSTWPVMPSTWLVMPSAGPGRRWRGPPSMACRSRAFPPPRRWPRRGAKWSSPAMSAASSSRGTPSDCGCPPTDRTGLAPTFPRPCACGSRSSPTRGAPGRRGRDGSGGTAGPPLTRRRGIRYDDAFVGRRASRA